MCTYIYFSNIGSFDGDDMPTPPNDPGVDPDDDQEMADAEDWAGANIPAPHVAQVPAGVRGRPNTIFRMDLGEQICQLLVEEGVKLATMREIRADHRLSNAERHAT